RLMPTLASHADSVEKVSSSGSPLAKPRIRTNRTLRSAYSASDRRQLRSLPLRFRTERFLLRVVSLELRTRLPRLQATYQHASTFYLQSAGQLAVGLSLFHRVLLCRFVLITVVGKDRKPNCGN